MAKIVLTAKHERYICRNYLKLSAREIGEKLGGIPKGTIASFLKREGLKVPRKVALAFQQRAQVARNATIVHPEDNKIRELYLSVPVNKLARIVGRSEVFVYGRLKALQLTIPAEIIEQRKRESRIQPGQVPFNKGKRQVEFMTRAGRERCKATQFKKGEIPPNKQHYRDGAITIRHSRYKDGRTTKPYQWIRVALRQWKMLHVFTWEKKHGPVPAGHIVVFRNGDTMDCRQRNLELITKAENMRRNTIHRYPEHVKSNIITLSKLKRKIKEYGIEK